jgi:hypothetical protein
MAGSVRRLGAAGNDLGELPTVSRQCSQAASAVLGMSAPRAVR